MKRLVPLLLLLACYTQAVGQYRGGGNDGTGLITASSLALAITNTSYTGGANDGVSSATAPLLSLIANSQYNGGLDDGSNAIQANGLSLASSSMYAGGLNDGTGSVASSALALSTVTMYAGGANDGVNSINASALALGATTSYTGGADDGAGSVVASALPFTTTSMYSGGANDGEHSLAALALNFTIPGNMYVGGGNDGYGSTTSTINVALPILWEEFTAIRNEKNALLTWKLGDENGIEGYEIERSFDGVNFRSIGYTNIHGGVFTSAEYNYTDIDPAAHCSNSNCTQVFYRIKEINYNKQFSFSATRRLPLDPSVISVTVYPNPATDKINIRWNLPGGQDINYDVALYNATGALMTSSKGLTTVTNETDIRQLPGGSYYIKITSGNKTYINEVTIIH